MKTDLKTDIIDCYIRKNNSYSENTIYPFLYETDFEAGIVERVRRIIRLNRADHPWNDLSDADFFRVAGLYKRDYVTEKEGFTMSALLLFGKEEAIQSAIPQESTYCSDIYSNGTIRRAGYRIAKRV